MVARIGRRSCVTLATILADDPKPPAAAPSGKTGQQAAATGKPLPPGSRPTRAPTDVNITTKFTKSGPISALDHTPVPLPPAPDAPAAADKWFDQVPTNPSAAPDLAAMSGFSTGATMNPVPQSPLSNMSAGMYDSGTYTGVRERVDSSHIRAPAPPGPWPPWVFPVLLSTTSLAVGMVLGAVLFANQTAQTAAVERDAGACPPVPSVVAALQPEPCQVWIDSQPSGAELSVGGKPKGIGPVQAALPCGQEVEITARLPDGKPVTRTVTPTAGAKNRLTVQLMEQLIPLTVTTKPPGAEVQLRGEPIGRAPITVELPAGAKVELTATKRGYRTAHSTVRVEAPAAKAVLRLKKRRRRR